MLADKVSGDVGEVTERVSSTHIASDARLPRAKLAAIASRGNVWRSENFEVRLSMMLAWLETTLPWRLALIRSPLSAFLRICGQTAVSRSSSGGGGSGRSSKVLSSRVNTGRRVSGGGGGGMASRRDS